MAHNRHFQVATAPVGTAMQRNTKLDGSGNSTPGRFKGEPARVSSELLQSQARRGCPLLGTRRQQTQNTGSSRLPEAFGDGREVPAPRYTWEFPTGQNPLRTAVARADIAFHVYADRKRGCEDMLMPQPRQSSVSLMQ
jgi:hypothetical protein